ncbi:MAG TPA: SDR family NAD(P)-dependent oxidoreductase, partial [Terriglobales bacterium]|nr:SDR family NAD(P)-dependent oxidoreductase [Terriglobales bacterium]
MSRLAGKIAVVTGAGTGIGRAIALAFAREGAQLALVGRRGDPLNAVAKQAGGMPLVLSADVSRQGDIDRVLAEVSRRFGGLNVLVNNAGILHIGTAEQISEVQWDQTFNINVR